MVYNGADGKRGTREGCRRKIEWGLKREGFNVPDNKASGPYKLSRSRIFGGRQLLMLSIIRSIEVYRIGNVEQ